MDTEGVEAAREWETVSVGHGHEGLRSLAGDGFSGGVTDGVAWAMLTNGRIVGLSGGTVESLADTDLTAYRAPDPALPLLSVMRERAGEPRAQYYTEETPIAEVDTRLQEGGFTGYLELSENVLSGDYYLVYHAGERLPVAFVGGSRRLVDGDEAFERADDEVGIYDVYDVDISVVDLPGTEVDEPDDAETAGVPDLDPDATDTEPGVTLGAATADDGTDPGDAADGETDDPLGVERDDGGLDAGHETAEPVEAATDDVEPESEPADDAEPESEPADDVEPESEPADDVEPESEPTDEVESESEPTDDAKPGVAVERLETERDDLRAAVERLETERDDLRAELDRVEQTPADAGDHGPHETLAPEAALSGTNLFVRYRSKTDPTIDEALAGDATREAVGENLQIEVHTAFDRDGVTVDGAPFETFLESSVQFRFVEWLVRVLPYELRDAGGKEPLGRLFESIAAFDRVEIDGTVDGSTFDVVVRNRTGTPLVVASVFDSREPATEEMLSDLVERAREAGSENGSLAAAMFVTTSYYAPAALELVEAEASGGGLFGRGTKESYVRLDRSHGFHLCLVEARDDAFHLGVPEL